jgi:hypothetical protein
MNPALQIQNPFYICPSSWGTIRENILRNVVFNIPWGGIHCHQQCDAEVYWQIGHRIVEEVEQLATQCVANLTEQLK